MDVASQNTVHCANASVFVCGKKSVVIDVSSRLLFMTLTPSIELFRKMEFLVNAKMRVGATNTNLVAVIQ